MKKWVALILILVAFFGVIALAETEGDYTYEIQADGTARIIRYTVPEKPEAILIPETLGGKKVTAIANFAFDDDRALTVQIPNTVTTIEGMAFSGASRQLRVMLPKNHPTLAEIDGNIYEKPTRTLVLGLNPQLNIPEGIQAIGKNACSMRTYTKITLPKSLKVIGDEAFGGATAPAFPLQEGIEVIGKQAFYAFECTGEAQSLVLPSTLKSLGDEAFMEAKIKMGVTRTDNRAHGSECRAKNSQDEYLQIVIPEGMEYLGQGAFQNIIIQSKGRKSFVCECTEISRSLDEARQDTQAILTGKPKGRYSAEVTARGIVQVTWPKDQENIPEAMFWQSGEAFLGGSIKKAYMHVTLPNTGDIQVGSRAFGGCEKVTFENACILTQVGDGAFSACYNVVFSQEVKLVSAGKDAFYDAKVEGEWQLDESLTQWPFNNARIEIKEIPAHITTLDENALIMDHSNLYLHSELTDIHEKAFTPRTTFQVEAYTYAAEWVMANNRQFNYAEPEDDLSWLSGGDGEDDLSWLNPEGDARYEEARVLEEAGDFEGAKAIYEELGDHKDAPQRLEEMNRRLAYEKAEALEEAGDYQAAYDAFKALGDFEDSAERTAALTVPIALQEARNLMAEKNFKAAWEKVEPLRKASAGAEKLYWEANFRQNGMAHAMSPEGTGWVDGYGLEWALMDYQGNVLTTTSYGHIGPWQDGYALAGEAKYLGSKNYYDSSAGRAYYNTQGQPLFDQNLKQATDFYQGRALVAKADGRLVIIDAAGEEVCELPEVKGRTYWHYVGENLVSFTENYKYGLMNLQGKVIVKAKYGDIKPFQYGLTLLKTNKGQSLINAKGKEVIKAGKYANIIILGEDMLAVQKKANSKTLSIVNLKGKENPKAKSNIDGGWIDAERQGDVILLKDKLRWWAFDLDMNPLEVYSEGTINVGYQNAVFHLDRGELNNLWNSKKDGKKALAKEGKNGDCKLSPDSPYILWKSEEKGWVIMDSDGNIIF